MSMRSQRLSPRARAAVALVREHGDAYAGDDSRYAPVSTEATRLIDGQPWIHWRTAYAIERAGLGRVEMDADGAELVLHAGASDA